jgi:L-lactate dehydrogenase complex protein LldG
MSRERILARIRDSLQQTRPVLEAEAARVAHTPPPYVHPPADDLAVQFAAELEKLGGYAHHCASAEAALTTLRSLLHEQHASSIIAWQFDQVALPGLAAALHEMGVTILDADIAHTTAAERTARLQTLEPAVVCLSGVDVAIAESGSVGLLSGSGRARMASLLAPLHIAVLPVSRIVRGLGEALTLVQQQHGADPFANHGSLTFITGPSRTADIEFTLTIGVHGPAQVHVLLIP